MKKIIFLVACLVVITSLVGCNAYKGLGKDVEKTGESIQGN